MNDPTPASLLSPELIAMMDKGVSVNVSSCSLDLRPSIVRAVGSALTAGCQTVTVYVARPQSRQLIQDVASTGRIAVVFSEPATHRTVQLKASGARIRCAEPSDEAVLARYLASMEQEIGRVGYGPAFTQAMLANRLEDVVAISFEPQQAFDQTPGPRAGAPLRFTRTDAT
ncbi:MAG: hypothetical protein PSV26_00680 [Polaromonas sp.]|uniref:hypothetical protein n=1 Tax=Polaromonas sp. TaxID=1869339 RepID=UPI0024895A74|nr:hypothetical protein [Polaromonas sp.]MDI1235978.1 hypothetical protein [Polaromonas sp.]